MTPGRAETPRHDHLGCLDPAAGLRRRDQPAAGRARHYVLQSPHPARAAQHRSADRLGGRVLSGCIRRGRGDAHHPDPRGRTGRHRGHPHDRVAQPQWPRRRHHRVQPHPRYRGRRQRRARRDQPGRGPVAGRGRCAADLQGRGRRRRDHVAQPALEHDGYARADRLHRPLRARPPVLARRRRTRPAQRQPALCDAHLARPRRDDRARRGGVRRGSRAAQRERRIAGRPH